VPGGVIPNQHKDLLALCLDLLAQPLQKVGGELAHGAALGKAEMHTITLSLKHPITGERFGIRVMLLLVQFL